MSARQWLGYANRVDTALYAAVARIDSPALDRAMHRVSSAANFSRLWLAVAGLLAVGGGRQGRRAAADGLASIAVTSMIVNLALKPLGRRRRPDRGTRSLATCLPRSRSFPSGHAASAFAFATGVAATLPQIGVPLRALAALVAYSRVHTGVHFPATSRSDRCLACLA